jgi:hypothetical protein
MNAIASVKWRYRSFESAGAKRVVTMDSVPTARSRAGLKSRVILFRRYPVLKHWAIFACAYGAA